MNETFLKHLGTPKSEMRKVREIDTSAEREIKIFHGPFITFFYVFLINDLLASFNFFSRFVGRKEEKKSERLIFGNANNTG